MISRDAVFCQEAKNSALGKYETETGETGLAMH